MIPNLSSTLSTDRQIVAAMAPPFQVQRLFPHACAESRSARWVLHEDHPLQLGRDLPDDADRLSLSGPLSSRQHALVLLQGGVAQVRDQGSKNGTYRNGERVQQAVLQRGDVLRVGGTVLILSQDRLCPGEEVAGLLGEASATQGLRVALHRAARAGGDILVRGESGSGKELVVRALHAQGRRRGRDGALLAVNCSAIPEGLAEALLFGTRARVATMVDRSTGYFRDAHNGTLFLDEIGDLPAALQPKLLRVLESREVLPVGASAPEPIDVRVIAATHRDLVAEVRNGRFRFDLYARLALRQLAVPALRERREDILLLLEHFLPGAASLLSVELAERMILHPWPRNVRGIKALAAVLADHDAAERPQAVARWLAEDASLHIASSPLAGVATPPALTPALPALAPSSPAPPGLPPSPEVLRERIVARDGKIILIASDLGLSRRHTLRLVQESRLLPVLTAAREKKRS